MAADARACQSLARNLEEETLSHTATPVLEGPLGESIHTSIQHIALIEQRERKLQLARNEAQQQVMHRIGTAHRNGELDDHQLCDLYDLFKATNTPNRSLHWNANVDIPWSAMRYLRDHLPNGPEGTWVGGWPSAGPVPRPGVPVVYVLYGPDCEPCYVGSTSTFRTRLNNHSRDGKQFTTWQAYRCQDREHAYQLEGRLLKEHMPRLNRRRGR